MESGSETSFNQSGSSPAQSAEVAPPVSEMPSPAQEFSPALEAPAPIGPLEASAPPAGPELDSQPEFDMQPEVDSLPTEAPEMQTVSDAAEFDPQPENDSWLTEASETQTASDASEFDTQPEVDSLPTEAPEMQTGTDAAEFDPQPENDSWLTEASETQTASDASEFDTQPEVDSLPTEAPEMQTASDATEFDPQPENDSRPIEGSETQTASDATEFDPQPENDSRTTEASETPTATDAAEFDSQPEVGPIVPEAPLAADVAPEAAAQQAQAPIRETIESVNKPVGEQMRDTEELAAAEVPLSPEADRMLKDGSAMNQNLVETVSPDITSPVRTDTEQNMQSDLAASASRIEAAQADAARKTVENVEAAARQEEPAAANGNQTIGSTEEDKAVRSDLSAETNRQDISERYNYSQFTRTDGAQIKQVSGQLGVPGDVETHRDEYQQRKMSGASGDHASHLVGDQFGARGDSPNLSSGNQHINLNSYKNLESSWANSLKDGSQIDVAVKDVSKPDEDRPFMRNVKWREADADGVKSEYELDFANTHSPESRLKQNIASTVPEGTNAEIIDLAEVRRKKQG